MARFSIALVAALAVAVVADPIRQKRANNLITAGAGAAASGVGWADDAHQAVVSAVGIPASGGSGWGDNSGWSGVPAAISIINAGASEVGQGAAILEATSNTADELSVIQTVDVDNYADAGDNLDVVAQGGQVDLASSSAADASGSGSIAAAGDVLVTSDGAGGWGMAKP